MENILTGCSSLKKLDITNLKVKNKTDIYVILLGCPKDLKKEIINQLKNKKIKPF